MSRGPQTFRQSDVTKAIKAAVKAGIEVGRIEINKSGKIVIVIAKDAGEVRTEVNEWDEVFDGAVTPPVR